jgi:hypothetical protein
MINASDSYRVFGWTSEDNGGCDVKYVLPGKVIWSLIYYPFARQVGNYEAPVCMPD